MSWYICINVHFTDLYMALIKSALVFQNPIFIFVNLHDIEIIHKRTLTINTYR